MGAVPVTTDEGFHLGFTGSSWRITHIQRLAVDNLLDRLAGTLGKIDWAHHGDCVVGDAMFHELAKYRGWRVHGHIPDNDKKRAFCDFDIVWDPAPYLVRNRDIVDCSDLMVAAPDAPEIRRSGTWATIRYARTRHVPLWIVMPDGIIHSENQEFV